MTSTVAGSVDIAVVRKTPLPSQLTDESIADLVGYALNQERATGDWQVAIAFVDSTEMQALHEQFMNDPSPTDILTFPYDESEISGGDIAICVGVADAQRSEYGKTLEDELLFLILHGILHLTGHDDLTDAERNSMLARQETLLDSWQESVAEQR